MHGSSLIEVNPQANAHGLSAVFLSGGKRRSDPVRRLRIERDVMVWGGPAPFESDYKSLETFSHSRSIRQMEQCQARLFP